jgi:hypothetical protein
MEKYLEHQSCVVQLFYGLHRKVPRNEFMRKLQDTIVSLKKIIFETNNGQIQKLHFDILCNLFTMIAYTRDIYGGLGERDLTYAMLFIWNYHFPVPTANAIYMMVHPLDNNPPYGSWKDIPNICNYVRCYSEKKEKDLLIDTCVGLMNHQLDEDAKTWDKLLDNCEGDGIHPSKIHPRDYGISLVAKWIPREGSSNNWLFDRLSLQWIKKFKPHYFQYTKDNAETFEKAFRKGKKEYRCIFSRLTKIWNVLERQQCLQEWNRIDPANIPMVATNKQTLALLNVGLNGKTRRKTYTDKDRLICAEKAKKYWQTPKLNTNPIFMNVGSLMKQAERSVHDRERQRIQNGWNIMLNQTPILDNMVSILDLSLFPNESFYSALGLSMMLSLKSNVFSSRKRLLAIDDTSHFITLNENETMFEMLEKLKPIYREHHMKPSMIEFVSHMVSIIKETEMTEESVSKMTWVLFSDRSYEELKELYKTIVIEFEKEKIYQVPRLVFWNFGSNFSTVEKDDMFYIPKTILLSGDTNQHLIRLSQVSDVVWEKATPYNFINHVLKQPRYEAIQNHFSKLLQKK